MLPKKRKDQLEGVLTVGEQMRWAVQGVELL